MLSVRHFAGLWGPSCELEVAVPVLMKLTEETQGKNKVVTNHDHYSKRDGDYSKGLGQAVAGRAGHERLL